MAINALKYLAANPGYTIVLLAGTGHAWKKAIPEQIRKRSPLSYTVILPRIPGQIEPGIVTNEDTDYIMLGPFLKPTDQEQFDPWCFDWRNR